MSLTNDELMKIFLQGPEVWNRETADIIVRNDFTINCIRYNVKEIKHYIFKMDVIIIGGLCSLKLICSSFRNLRLVKFDMECGKGFSSEIDRFHYGVEIDDSYYDFLSIEDFDCNYVNILIIDDLLSDKFNKNKQVDCQIVNSNIKYINLSGGNFKSIYINSSIFDDANFSSLNCVDLKIGDEFSILKVEKVLFNECKISNLICNLNSLKYFSIEYSKLDSVVISCDEVSIFIKLIDNKINNIKLIVMKCFGIFDISYNRFVYVPDFCSVACYQPPEFIMNEIRFNNLDSSDNIEQKCRGLRILAIQSHNSGLEQDMLALELRYSNKLRYKNILSVKGWVIRIYGLLSDYGRSLGRPLVLWGMLVYTSGCFYWMFAKNGQDQCVPTYKVPSFDAGPGVAAMMISVKNGLLSLGMSQAKTESLYECLLGKNNPLPPWFFVLEMAQTVFSGLLIFLFIKAIHNLVRLK